MIVELVANDAVISLHVPVHVPPRPQPVTDVAPDLFTSWLLSNAGQEMGPINVKPASGAKDALAAMALDSLMSLEANETEVALELKEKQNFNYFQLTSVH